MKFYHKSIYWKYLHIAVLFITLYSNICGQGCGIVLLPQYAVRVFARYGLNLQWFVLLLALCRRRVRKVLIFQKRLLANDWHFGPVDNSIAGNACSFQSFILNCSGSIHTFFYGLGGFCRCFGRKFIKMNCGNFNMQIQSV